ncbi:hypothetical protein TWF481_010383 [Arthrobotrys musiformis]|uniref:Uncharacterized protein n=1 Tax=Arthrobotrys musiformis TaxID=47236 RepID=A0AAV9W0K8_9PEZI
MSDITPLPKIPKYTRASLKSQSQNITNNLVHAQFKVDYFNKRTGNWRTIQFASVTYVLRDGCTNALERHLHLLEPRFSNFKHQSLLAIEAIYNDVFTIIQNDTWNEAIKSTAYDMLKATEFPEDPHQDKWLFFWIMSQVRHKLNRRGKAKGVEAEAEASTEGQKLEQAWDPERQAEKEFEDLDEQRKRHSKAPYLPLISNIIHEKDEFPTRQPSFYEESGCYQ